MKIAFLSHLDTNLYLFRLPIMLELVKMGHTVYAVVPKGEVDFEKLNIRQIDYKIERKSINPFTEIKTIQNIYMAIKNLDLDIIHTFTVKPNIYGTIAAKMSKVPKIINSITGMGSFFIDNSPKSLLIRFVIKTLYRLLFRYSNCVIFQNGDDMNYFISHKIIKSSKATFIKGSGIDTSVWIRDMRVTQPTIVVLMVARLLKHKGVLEYIEASQILSKEYNNVEFWYIGGSDSGNHSTLSEDYISSIDSIKYLGEQKNIKDYMNMADIFVLPSYREGMPRTIIEASSMGLPIVTTDTVGCRESIIDGENGFLVPIQDSKALALAIEKLIIDDKLRVKFAKKSREIAKKDFDIKKIVKFHLDIYNFK